MAPNPKCIVCSEKPQVVVKIDTNRVTVKQFRDEVLVKALNMLEPDVITEGKGLVLISSEEGETDCNNDKKLNELEVVDGAILKVDDFVQQYELTVIIAHKEADRDGDLYEVIADPDSLKPEAGVDEKAEAPAAADAAAAAPSKETDNGEPKAKKPRHEEPKQAEDSDDDLCIIEDGAENDSNRPTTSSSSSAAPASSSSSSILGKHKSDHHNNQAAGNSSSAEAADKMDVENAPSTSSEPRNKRPRVQQDDDDDLIIIDDD